MGRGGAHKVDEVVVCGDRGQPRKLNHPRKGFHVTRGRVVQALRNTTTPAMNEEIVEDQQVVAAHWHWHVVQEVGGASGGIIHTCTTGAQHRTLKERDQYCPVTGGNFRKSVPTCMRYASVRRLEVFENPWKDARKFWQPDRPPKTQPISVGMFHGLPSRPCRGSSEEIFQPEPSRILVGCLVERCSEVLAARSGPKT